MGHFQAVENEYVVGDGGGVDQAVRQYTEAGLWKDVHSANTFVWLVIGLIQPQKSALPEWITFWQSKARFAQSRERQSRQQTAQRAKRGWS